MIPYNKNLKPLSQHLRTECTDSERKLWSHLRGKQLDGIQFYRQKIIGNYIVDFYAPKMNLVIEVDGEQHLEVENLEKDRMRDEFLWKQGLTVLRFSNFQVLQEMEGVLRIIEERLKEGKDHKIPLRPL